MSAEFIPWRMTGCRNRPPLFPELPAMPISAPSSPRVPTLPAMVAVRFLALLGLNAPLAGQAERLLPGGSLAQDGYGLPVLADVSGDGRIDLLGTRWDLNGMVVRLGRPDGTFGPAEEYASALFPQLSADFTGDGLFDVLAFNTYEGPTVIVLPGTGSGTFSSPIATTVLSLDNFTEVVAGDANADGALDLLLTDFGDACKCGRILFGLGDGTFQIPAMVVALGNQPSSPAFADVTGDGLLDLLALIHPQQDMPRISVAPNDDAGGFGTAIKTILDFQPTTLLPADLDEDGLSDAVVTGWDDEQWTLVSLLRGDGGVFTKVAKIPLWNEPPQGSGFGGSPFRGDVDNDGAADLLVATHHLPPFQGGVWFLRGLGGFDFTAPTFTDTDVAYCFEAQFADLDADGRIDVAWEGFFGNSLMVSFGSGDGSYEVPGRIDLGLTTADIATGDLDLDGIADLVVTSQEPALRALTLLGVGNGSFVAQQPAGTPHASEALVADLTCDDVPDVVTFSAGMGGVALLAGHGDGTLAAAQELMSGFARDVAVGDIDLDGHLDLAVSRPDLGAVHVLLAQGGGNFQSPVAVATTADVGGVLLADLTADGLADLGLTAELTGHTLVYSGLGGAVFDLSADLEAYYGPRDVEAGDLDNDDDLDLVTVCSDVFLHWTSTTVVHHQVASGGFSPPLAFYNATFSDEIIVTDFDRDGLPDLLSSPIEDEFEWEVIQFHHGLPNGTWSASHELRTGAAPSGAAVADFDQDGFPDVAVSHKAETNVRIYLNRSPDWATLGHALPSASVVPLLEGAGAAAPDQLVQLSTSLAAGPALGLLFVGFDATFEPFQGGLLVPSIDAVVPIRPQDTLADRWPNGIPPGTPVYVQAWFATLGGGEVSATNALVTIAQ